LTKFPIQYSEVSVVPFVQAWCNSRQKAEIETENK